MFAQVSANQATLLSIADEYTYPANSVRVSYCVLVSDICADTDTKHLKDGVELARASVSRMTKGGCGLWRINQAHERNKVRTWLTASEIHILGLAICVFLVTWYEENSSYRCRRNDGH